jgi:hypothetical protein
MSFYVFSKFSILYSKSKVVAYGFSENHQFGTKTEWNSVFHGHDPHIADQLYISVSYMNLYGFWKNLNFRLKSVGVSLAHGFSENYQFGEKTDRNSVFFVVISKLRIGYT